MSADRNPTTPYDDIDTQRMAEVLAESLINNAVAVCSVSPIPVDREGMERQIAVWREQPRNLLISGFVADLLEMALSL